MFIRNAWYAIAESRDIAAGEILARTVMNGTWWYSG